MTYSAAKHQICIDKIFIESGNFRIGKIVKIVPDIIVECNIDKLKLLCIKFDDDFAQSMLGTLHIGQIAQVYRRTNDSCTLIAVK